MSVFRCGAVPADWPRLPAAPKPAAPAAPLRVSVVVPTSGRLPLLMRCLQALLAQQIDVHSFEILVVDANRDKATRRAVQALARTLPPHLLHYLRPLDKTPGPAAARNRGWRAARAPLIAFTDESAVPDAAWLLEGDKAMHDKRCVALAGPVLVQRRTDAKAPPPGRAATYKHPPRPVALDSANSFVWRKALQAVGGIDDRFPDSQHQDADLQFRLQREGPVGSCPAALVVRTAAAQGWGDALHDQHDRFFDALLFREHPGQYRSHLVAAPPAGSYAVVGLALAALAALLIGNAVAAQFLAAGSLTGIFALAWRRLRRGAVRPRSWPQALALSVLIPFLAVYWRLRGAWHYGVWFV